MEILKLVHAFKWTEINMKINYKRKHKYERRMQTEIPKKKNMNKVRGNN